MQKFLNKFSAIATCLFLILSMSASIILIPTYSAHSPPWTITDSAYVAVEPNPTGISQPVLITIWTAQPLVNSAITNNSKRITC